MPICALTHSLELPWKCSVVGHKLSPLPKTPTPSQSTCVPPHCTSRHQPLQILISKSFVQDETNQEFCNFLSKQKTRDRKEPNMHRINILDTRMGAEVNQPHRHYESGIPSNENSTQSLWSSTILLQTITVWHERRQHMSPRPSVTSNILHRRWSHTFNCTKTHRPQQYNISILHTQALCYYIFHYYAQQYL